MIALAWARDLGFRRRADFGFWLHLFGAMTFWGALTAGRAGSEVTAAAYCAVNVALLLVSVYLGRRVFAVFGTIGIAFYLGHP
ncbi:hypothetical protein J8J40_32460, partial [Mycobacterium tuberculosis]|nr:hypothetical protein [Mycobacterium tuberculosis]